MQRFEIVGNVSDTMCKALGERLTLGAAKKLADQLMLAEVDRVRVVGGEMKFYSVDVDDGRSRVLYTAEPSVIFHASPLRSFEPA